tara:strand:- start:743 stop:1363 length:621 start_codon:yes stop_codon:yes gene_type:complete
MAKSAIMLRNMENIPTPTPPPETPETEEQRAPLWKQLVGAVVGGSLALGLYYGYELAEPNVKAILALPPAERMFDPGAANIADKTTDEGNRKRLLSRNVRNAQMLEGNNDPSRLDTVDTHELDVTWPGHAQEEPDVVAELPELEVMEEEMLDVDEWDDLWEDIKDREYEDEEVEESNAEDLPDTGFGLGLAVAGALGGALGMRKRK